MCIYGYENDVWDVTGRLFLKCNSLFLCIIVLVSLCNLSSLSIAVSLVLVCFFSNWTSKYMDMCSFLCMMFCFSSIHLATTRNIYEEAILSSG